MKTIADLLFSQLRHSMGSDDFTGKVLKQIRLKNQDPTLGVFHCGTGEQVFLLAKKYPKSTIQAIDSCGLYFSALQEKAARQGVSNRIHLQESPLEKPPFPEQYFDLILSEGAIEHLNFCQRLDKWRPCLKYGGYLLLTEPCLLTNKELPDELYRYFDSQYPYKELETIEYHLKQIKGAGYKFCTRYTLPDTCCYDYYANILKTVKTYPKKTQSTADVRHYVEEIEHHLYMHQTYQDYFSYMYFSVRKAPLTNAESIHNKELSKLQRKELENFLIEKLCEKECNTTLRFTQSWLTDHIERENHKTILSDFRSRGGYCDCEILANVFHTIIEEIE